MHASPSPSPSPSPSIPQLIRQVVNSWFNEAGSAGGAVAGVLPPTSCGASYLLVNSVRPPESLQACQRNSQPGILRI